MQLIFVLVVLSGLLNELIATPPYLPPPCSRNPWPCEQKNTQTNGCTNVGDNDFTCSCYPGFDGKNCSHNIDECALKDRCVNGKCIDGDNCWTCECNEGWIKPVNADGSVEETCTIELPCHKNPWPCVRENTQVNGCSNIVTGSTVDFKCTCLAGFTGKDCSINIDDCVPKDTICGKGVCVDGIASYTCTCNAGWTKPAGKEICSQELKCITQKPCAPLTSTGCTDTLNDYVCACVKGYEGKNCDKNIDDCVPKDTICGNGVCVDGIASYTCTCNSGWTKPAGKEICSQALPCSSLPWPCVKANTVLNGCTNVGNNDFKCTCLAGFTGKDCSINIDDCLPAGKCGQGVCVDGINSFTCKCNPGWTNASYGPVTAVCNQDIDECATGAAKCAYGQICVNTPGSFSCK